MDFSRTEVWGFEHAIRGMRNPLESWEKSDSYKCKYCNDKCVEYLKKNCADFFIGAEDLKLMKNLIKAGSDHRKFMRQIMVSVDITAPLYWWKEFDTYKVGTVANSESTMHKLASTPITKECFEMGDFENIDIYIEEGEKTAIDFFEIWQINVNLMERLRIAYNETKDKTYWKELIRFLPESWLQTRTLTMNYENLLSMVHSRKSHKLTEWSLDFVAWVKSLPYAEELLLEEKEND